MGPAATATSTRAQLTQAFAKGAREPGCRDPALHRGHRPRARQRRRMAGRYRQRRTIAARSWSTPPAIGPARSWRCSASTCRSSRCRTSIWSPRTSRSWQRGTREAAAAARSRRLLLPAPGAPGLLLGPYEWQCRGRCGWTASRPTSPTSSGPTISAGSSATSRMPARACRSWPRVGVQARGQRPDPLLAGRQPLYRPGARAAQLLPLLLLQLRHRPGRRGRQVPGRMGRRRRARVGRLGVRSAPLHRLRHHRLHRRQGASSSTRTNTPSPSRSRSARPGGRARTTPLYAVLQAKGARFGARGGWERAAFFDPRRHDRRADA